MRWGDSADLDDEVGDFEMALPAPQVRDRDPHACRCARFPVGREKDAGAASTRDRPRLTLTPPFLPALPQITGPDANGVKTVIEYRQKEDGSKVRDRHVQFFQP